MEDVANRSEMNGPLVEGESERMMNDCDKKKDGSSSKQTTWCDTDDMRCKTKIGDGKNCDAAPVKSILNTSKVGQLVLKFELEAEGPDGKVKIKPLQGYILLTMSCGQFPVDLYAHQKRLLKGTESFLEEYILSSNICSEVSPGSFLKLDRVPEIRHAFFVGAPLLMKDSQKFRLFLKFATVHWIMDDYIKRSSSGQGYMPFLTRAFFTDLAKICTNIISGIYRKSEAVPYFEVPLFHHCLVALYEIQKELEQSLGQKQYEKYYQYFLQELLDWIEGHKMEVHNFSGSRNLGFSQETFIDCKRYLTGRGSLLEFIQLLYGNTLDIGFRETKLFKMLWKSGILVHALTQDILGGKWDNERNLIRRIMHSENKPFHKAFEDSVEGLNDVLMDFQKIAQDILSECPKLCKNYERIQRFVRNFQFFVDGGIRGLVEDWKRGKKGKFQVLKVKV